MPGDEYRRRLTIGDQKVLLDRAMPLVGRLPADKERARQKIIAKLLLAKKPAMGGYPHVAVPEYVLTESRMKEMGFEPTRLSTPIAGEAPFTTSWRSNELHAHKQGPMYLIHQDKVAPRGLRSISHAINEGIPSLFWFDRSKKPVEVIEDAMEKRKNACWNSFVHELDKIAESKIIVDPDEKLFSPGVVAHEAGHGVMHTQMPGLRWARSIPPALASLSFLGKMIAGKDVGALDTGLMAASYLPMLFDEAASSIKGYKALEASKELTKNQLKQERNKLLAAGATYAAAPATLAVSTALMGRKLKKEYLIPVNLALIAGSTILPALAAHYFQNAPGPLVSAKKAKNIVEKMAPGTDVYVSAVPIPGGSIYVPKPNSNFERKQIAEMAKMYLFNRDEYKRFVQNGGVISAPIAADKARGTAVLAK